MDVPKTLESLLVPKIVAGNSCGKAENKAGTWINPPPPTTASIKPAKKAALAKIRKIDAFTSLSACALGFNRTHIYNNYKDKLRVKSVDNLFLSIIIKSLTHYFAHEKSLY